MRGALLALLLCLAAGCKDNPSKLGASPGSGSGSAGVTVVNPHAPRVDAGPPPPVDWPACEAAVALAKTAPPHQRAKVLIDGCRVCGDWTPILRWNTPQDQGGPTRTDIEAAMATCNAYCSGEAKLKFLGTLDDARGKPSRMPWRQLAELCKGEVSAVPDQRFMSAPLFALDRIARAVTAHGGAAATDLASLALPLPALTLVGTGVPLPAPELPTAVEGQLHVTVLGEVIHVGRLPQARLGATGVAVELGPDGYPGTQVPLAGLGAAVEARWRDDKTQTVLVLAPHGMPAARLVPIIAAITKAAPTAPLFLGAAGPQAPEGWQLPVGIPAPLDASGKAPAIVTTDAMTVQQLAAELAKLATAGDTRPNRVGVVAP